MPGSMNRSGSRLRSPNAWQNNGYDDSDSDADAEESAVYLAQATPPSRGAQVRSPTGAGTSSQRPDSTPASFQRLCLGGSSSSAGELERHLLSLTQRLLDAIVAGDYETYQELCDPSLSAFEPEAAGCLVQGLEFHE